MTLSRLVSLPVKDAHPTCFVSLSVTAVAFARVTQPIEINDCDHEKRLSFPLSGDNASASNNFGSVVSGDSLTGDSAR